MEEHTYKERNSEELSHSYYVTYKKKVSKNFLKLKKKTVDCDKVRHATSEEKWMAKKEE